MSDSCRIAFTGATWGGDNMSRRGGFANVFAYQSVFVRIDMHHAGIMSSLITTTTIEKL